MILTFSSPLSQFLQTFPQIDIPSEIGHQLTFCLLLQELASLQTVIDLRLKEIHGMRTMNADLNKRLERQYWMESELGKARQRVEEMNLVVQNKMVAEK